MKLPQFLKTFIAWIAKTPTEASAMTEEITPLDPPENIMSANQAMTIASAAVVSASDPLITVQAVAVASSVVDPAVNTDTLMAVLAALGYDLDAVWDEAIALAKKAV